MSFAIPFVFGLAFRGAAVIPEIGGELLAVICVGGIAGLVGGAVFALVGSPFE